MWRTREAQPSPTGVSPDGMILILGAPRSGTTWLATIFDSHEAVLYRHEPDTIDRGTQIPGPCPRHEIHRHRAAARDYLLRLATLSKLKCAGHPWAFRKNYRSTAAGALRFAKIIVLRILAAAWGGAVQSNIADHLRTGTKARVVIKSVSGCGNAGLYAAALPEARIIFVIRSPFGQVSSMIRGTSLRKLDGARAVDGLWEWPEARAYGLARDDFEAMPLAERLAWHWVLLTEKAIADLEGRPGVRVVCYEQLCAHPEDYAGELFDFVGLEMGEQTRRFLRKSTCARAAGAYYAICKNTSEAAGRWRRELSADDQATVAAVVGPTRAFALYRSLAPSD